MHVQSLVKPTCSRSEADFYLDASAQASPMTARSKHNRYCAHQFLICCVTDAHRMLDMTTTAPSRCGLLLMCSNSMWQSTSAARGCLLPSIHALCAYTLHTLFLHVFALNTCRACSAHQVSYCTVSTPHVVPERIACGLHLATCQMNILSCDCRSPALHKHSGGRSPSADSACSSGTKFSPNSMQSNPVWESSASASSTPVIVPSANEYLQQSCLGGRSSQPATICKLSAADAQSASCENGKGTHQLPSSYAKPVLPGLDLHQLKGLDHAASESQHMHRGSDNLLTSKAHLQGYDHHQSACDMSRQDDAGSAAQTTRSSQSDATHVNCQDSHRSRASLQHAQQQTAEMSGIASLSEHSVPCQSPQADAQLMCSSDARCCSPDCWPGRASAADTCSGFGDGQFSVAISGNPLAYGIEGDHDCR